MLYHIYHIESDSFIYNGSMPDWASSDCEREMRVLFCNFRQDCDGVIIQLIDKDLDHLLMCQVALAYNRLRPDNELSFPVDHKKLYDYLIELGVEDIRFIPVNEDSTLNYRRSFALSEWSF